MISIALRWIAALAVLAATAAASAQFPVRYNGPSNLNESQGGAFIDPDGNIIVICTSAETGQGDDVVTLKYDRNANLMWSARFNGTHNKNDEPRGAALDPQGNIYITATTTVSKTRTDFVTFKYNNNGVLQWSTTLSGVAHGMDEPSGIAVNAAGDVVVVGDTDGGSTSGTDVLTVMYDTNGNQQWKKVYTTAGAQSDTCSAVGFGPDNSVFVGASVNDGGFFNDMAVIKYSGTGAKQFVRTYDGTGHRQDLLTSLKVDASGNVFVTGGSTNADFDLDMVTIKYDGLGNRQWVARQNSGGDTDYPTSLALDPSGNILVCGITGTTSNKTDYITLKYDAFGNKQWVKKYSGSTGTKSGDLAVQVQADTLGNVYVVGTTQVSAGIYDITSIKYSDTGQVRWINIYDSPTHGNDQAGGFALDSGRGRIYVTGKTPSLDGTNDDLIVIRY